MIVLNIKLWSSRLIALTVLTARWDSWDDSKCPFPCRYTLPDLITTSCGYCLLQIGAATGKLKRFIIEPFVAHKQVKFC